MRAALLVTPSADFVALTFALFRAGAVIVLIDPGIGAASIGRCLAEAAPEAFIGVPKAHLARLALRWAPGARLLVTAGRRWFWGGLTLADLRRLGRDAPSPGPAATPDTAAIMFTSGSTGAPKGAVYTHAMFAAQAEMLRSYFGIKPGGASVPTFPLFALFDVALGLTIHLPEMDFTRPAAVNPEMLAGLINASGAEQLFGSPALLETLSRYGWKNGVKLPSLNRVISGGAPAHAAVIERVKTMLLPGVQVYTPYGATEALPVSCISSGELAALPTGPGVCVGRPWPGVEVKVIRITDASIKTFAEAEVLPAGEIGEIAVSGPVVSARYYSRPDGDALAKMAGPGEKTWHRMGDAGWFDTEGRLWFCGRKSHRVTTAGGPMFTIPCEAVFNAHPQVRRTALVGVGPAGAQAPVLCVELEPDREPSPELTKELLDLGAAQPLTRAVKRLLYHPGFPVDIRHNAKIAREKLAAWAAGETGL
jgi:olefin beta-lactone synthetase